MRSTYAVRSKAWKCGGAAAASGRNNESKYGQWKTSVTKGRKSGHCELQRTTRGKVLWISSLGKHQGRVKEKNTYIYICIYTYRREEETKGKRRRRKRGGSIRYCRKTADVSVIAHTRSRHTRSLLSTSNEIKKNPESGNRSRWKTNSMRASVKRIE